MEQTGKVPFERGLVMDMHTSPPVVIDGASFDLSSGRQLTAPAGPGLPYTDDEFGGRIAAVRAVVFNDSNGSCRSELYTDPAGMTVTIYWDAGAGEEIGATLTAAGGTLSLQCNRRLTHHPHTSRRLPHRLSAHRSVSDGPFQVTKLVVTKADGTVMPPSLPVGGREYLKVCMWAEI